MKRFLIIVTALLSFNALLISSAQQLSPIDSLKELPVKLVADFMDSEDIASYATPAITKEGTIFFYDQKLKQVFKTSIDNPQLIPIGRNGEGPQEYTVVYDLFIHRDFLYILEMKQKLLCFGTNGVYNWESRLGFPAERVIGKKADTYYIIEGFSKTVGKVMYEGLYTWKKGEKRQLLLDLPGIHQEMNAFINGKLVPGAGFSRVARPVFCFVEDRDSFITAADTRYCFNILDARANLQKTVSLDAPSPELNEVVKTFNPPFKKPMYAISDIFCQPPYIIVISNYFKDRKQRVDFFSMEGVLKKSFLLPFQVKAKEPNRPVERLFISIANGFLSVADDQEVGFKVYRSPEF